MKELKGEPTFNCNTCQYRKRKGSQYTGVLIRDPDFYGKCCRPGGCCDRHNMIEGQENNTILDAIETQEKEEKQPWKKNDRQLNLFIC